MTPAEYQRDAERTESKLSDLVGHREDSSIVTINSRILHAIMGMVTETGELMDLLKKHIFYGKLYSKAQLEDELGDTIWYLILLCNALGISMEKIMEKNIAKLRVRYPEKFTSENALNRDLKKEEEVFECEHVWKEEISSTGQPYLQCRRCYMTSEIVP